MIETFQSGGRTDFLKNVIVSVYFRYIRIAESILLDSPLFFCTDCCSCRCKAYLYPGSGV